MTAEEIEALRENNSQGPMLERSRAGRQPGLADIRALSAIWHSSCVLHQYTCLILSRVTLYCDILFTCQVLAYLSVSSLRSGASVHVHVHTCARSPTAATQETLNLPRYPEGVRNLPKPLRTLLPKAETNGWERRGKENNPASQCQCCSPTSWPPPSRAAGG